MIENLDILCLIIYIIIAIRGAIKYREYLRGNLEDQIIYLFSTLFWPVMIALLIILFFIFLIGEVTMPLINKIIYKPEKENGNLVGYKYLSPVGDILYSPLYNVRWTDFKLSANRIPDMDNESGIYCAKKPYCKSLKFYAEPTHVLVKMYLTGKIVEHDNGFRAEKAEVIAWKFNKRDKKWREISSLGEEMKKMDRLLLKKLLTEEDK